MYTLEDLRPWLDSLAAACSDPVMYGFSDIGDFLPEALRPFPRAITLAVRLDDDLVDSIEHGPHAAYYAEYSRINALLNELSENTAAHLQQEGYAAHWIPSSTRVDFENILGEFPHKTGAVRAGLGWIGRSSMLITRDFGPRVRLGTVLTDLPLAPEEAAKPLDRSYCGSCAKCVTACPVKAVKGEVWTPGLERDRMLDVLACDNWKKDNFPQFKGMVCGICVSVCPYGKKRRKKVA